MAVLFSAESAWLLICAIALVSVLACLRAIAQVLGQVLALHNLRVETLERRRAAMQRADEGNQRITRSA